MQGTARKKAQVDETIAQWNRGETPTITAVPGALRPVSPGDGHDQLIEISDPQNPHDLLSAWIAGKPKEK